MNRLLRDLLAILRALQPELPFLRMYRFRVVSNNPSDHRWVLQPISKASGLDPIGPAELHPGMAGLVAELATGSEVIVAFVDGQPVILAHQAPDKPGWLPTTLTMDASDTVKVGPSASMVELGSGDDLVADPTGRVVRWGDPIPHPVSGVSMPLIPFPGSKTAKVTA